MTRAAIAARASSRNFSTPHSAFLSVILSEERSDESKEPYCLPDLFSNYRGPSTSHDSAFADSCCAQDDTQETTPQLAVRIKDEEQQREGGQDPQPGLQVARPSRNQQIGRASRKKR